MCPSVSGCSHFVSCFPGSATLWQVSVLPSLLWLSNIPSRAGTTFHVSTHQLADIGLPPPLGTCEQMLQTRTYKVLFESLFSVLGGIFLGVELLGHVAVCLAF